MRDFFSLDGAFNKYGGLIADVFILSLVWVFFSIPLVTIGASTSAMFYVSTRRIAEREGYITSDFWDAFKTNFVRATKMWLMVCVVVLIIIFNIFNIGVVGNMSVVILPAQIIILVQIMMLNVYLFPLTARFEMGVFQTFKSAFYMANRHLLTSITCMLILASFILAALYFEPLFLITPGAYAILSSYLIMRVFKKYRPEMDKDPVLEIQELEVQKAEERRRRGISTFAAPDEDDNESNSDIANSNKDN